MPFKSIRHRPAALALAVALLSAAAAGPAGGQTVVSNVGALPPGSERPTRTVLLSVGEGERITLPSSITNVWTSNADVADVYVASPRVINLFGKEFGEATVYATNASGAVVYSANVRVNQNITTVDRVLATAMPEADIKITNVGQYAILTGTVNSPDDAATAEMLVRSVLNPGLKPDELQKMPVINRLRTATPLQVNLQVRFAEVSRTLLREIGNNMVTRDNTGGFTFGVSRGRVPGTIAPLDTSNLPQLDASSIYGLPAGSIRLPFDPTTGQFITGGTQYAFNRNTAGQTALGFAGKLLGLDILSTFDIGERIGLVTTLSQPNLTAISGETADFLAGGEYPIPISQGLGTTTIEYRKYGVSLAYTPTVLANGRISLRVRPEVSELSTEGAVTLNGFQVPALTIRRAETTVELGSGQSFMIAGLMSNSAQNQIEKAPGIGDIPILGSLFRSTSFRKGQTELVIVVTPYLVNPVNDADIKLPTDGFQAPNEIQRLLGNISADGKTGGDRPKPTMAPDIAPVPQVGELSPAQAPAPAQKPAKGKRRADAATAARPGFELN